MTAYLSIIAIKAHFRIHFDMTHWEDDESFQIPQDYKSKNKRNNKKKKEFSSEC